jgi:hypothetical protein
VGRGRRGGYALPSWVEKRKPRFAAGAFASFRGPHRRREPRLNPDSWSLAQAGSVRPAPQRTRLPEWLLGQ